MRNMPYLPLAIGIFALFGLLCLRFPYILEDESNRIRLLYLLLFLLLCSGSLTAMARRSGIKRVVQNACIWLCIMLALVDGYSFRDDIMNSRIMGELMPQHMRIHADGTLELVASANGAFYAEARVNGMPVRFMIDTGASDIMLSPADASRLGFHLEESDYTRNYATANGYGRGAAITLRTLRLGTITLTDVPASVNRAPMGQSLLGMAFLRRVGGFRISGRHLLLNP